MKMMLVVDGIGVELRTTGSEVEAICFLELSASTTGELEMPWVGECFQVESTLS